MKKAIETSLAPKPVGPYSQAIAVNGYLFCSGQVSIDPLTDQVILADIETQAKRVMENIQAVLKSNQMNWHDVIKTTIFLTDMNDFQTVNQVYASYLTAPYPARSTVAVAGLPKGVKVEIEVLAYRN